MKKTLKNIPKKYKQIYLELLNENKILKNELLLLKEQVKLFLHRKYSSNADEISPSFIFVTTYLSEGSN